MAQIPRSGSVVLYHDSARHVFTSAQHRGESDTRGEGRNDHSSRLIAIASTNRIARQPANQPPSLRVHPSSPRGRERERIVGASD